MAYAALTDLNLDDILAEEIWQILVDNTVYFKDRIDNPPRALVYHSTTQSIANNSATVVVFDSEYQDSNSLHSTSSNTGRLTVPTGEAGSYLLTGHIEFDANATGQRGLQLRHQGSNVIAAIQVDAAAGGLGTRLTVAMRWTATAGQYFELLAYQNSGGALNVLASSAAFSIQRVA